MIGPCWSSSSSSAAASTRRRRLGLAAPRGGGMDDDDEDGCCERITRFATPARAVVPVEATRLTARGAGSRLREEEASSFSSLSSVIMPYPLAASVVGFDDDDDDDRCCCRCGGETLDAVGFVPTTSR
mmetsp:Transcript_3560/g.11991  ORF Transcript_3560/g.11991 Transcript_3560/m.11991 type:complete len:128 (+) Transcript_3560:3-386(+)